MPRYALVDNMSHKVINVVVWDGDFAKWSPPVDRSAVQTATANIGDLYDGVGFSTPAPVPLTKEETDFRQAVALLQNTFNTARNAGQINNCIDGITVILRRIVSDLAS